MMVTALDKKTIHKSWKQASNMDQVVFKQKNLIFGLNGSGKSSFSYLIQENFLRKNGLNQIRIFNDKYINETLSLKDGSIRGVISNFGKKNVDIEKFIENNMDIVKELQTQLAQNRTTLATTQKESEKFIDEIVNRRKGLNSKIHNKPKDRSTEEKVRLWIKDYDDSIKQFPNENYNGITGDIDYSLEHDRILKIPIPTFKNFGCKFIDEFNKLLTTNFQDVDIPCQTVIDWLEAGLGIHEGQAKCEFCGSPINYEEVKIRITTYLNNEKQKATRLLMNIREYLVAVDEVADWLIRDFDNHKESFSLSVDESSYIALKESEITIKLAVDAIDKKIKDMNVSVSVDDEFLKTAINTIIDYCEFLDNSKNEYSQKLLEKINRLELLVKGAIGYEIKNSKIINENSVKILELEKEMKRLEGEIEKINTENDAFKTQKSDLSDFADFLDSTLKDINLDFFLKLDGDVYLLRHKDGIPLQLDDISEGERNLLSLIYFYYEMLSNDKGDFKEEINLVVLDDPISSLDENNKFYILEIMKTLLDQKNIQLFICTHSWSDFCDLAYGRNDTDVFAFFEIKKESGISRLIELDTRKLLSPYIQMYCEIERFCEKKIEDISVEESLHLPNTMRRVLEEYAKFNVNIDNATAAHTGDIAKALFKKELSELSLMKRQKLDQLLSICNILSHKATQPHNPSEIHESAKFLINTIKDNDKYHHYKMICNQSTM